MYKIFVSGMAYDSGRSGISVYINNVVEALAEEHSIDIIMLKEDKDAFPVKNPNLNIKTYPSILNKPIINMLWHLFILPFIINFRKYDFIFLPAANRRLLCRYPKYTVATVHDLSQFHIQGKYDLFRTLYIKKIVPYFVKKAHHLIGVSKSTCDDIVKYYGFKGENLTVNHNGYSSDIFNTSPIPSSFNIVDKYGIDKKFILYISRIEHPGKNHINMMKAYEILPEKIKNEYLLVFAGKLWPGSEPVLKYAEDSSEAASIKFLSYVPYEDLPSLYKSASLYAFPSFFEGFGIPLIESMACGIPTICSDRSSLPEIGGDAVLTFNPDSPEEICGKMKKVMDSTELRESLIRKGLQQVKLFNWKTHASKIIEIYEKNNRV